MGYIKLERDKIKAKIHRDYVKAIKRLDPEEAVIYCIEQNPKCTGIEFARGIWPVLYHEAKYLWTRVKNVINLSDRYLDEHIIGVDEIVTNVSTGKKQLITYVELAKGYNAIVRAKTFDKHIKGFKDKQKDLEDKYADKDHPRRLNRKKKMREQIVGSV